MPQTATRGGVGSSEGRKMKNRYKKLVEFSDKKLKTILRILPKRNRSEPPAMESNDIIFKFQPEKTVQVAAMFLKLHGRGMKYLGLLKLIYMADRLALEKINQPLTGDTYVSMKYGPVLSRIYDFIKGTTSFNNEQDALNIWKKYILTPNNYSAPLQLSYEVILLKDPGSEELSEEEEEIIEEIYKKCGNYDRFDLANMTHNFPEWQNPQTLNSSQKVVPIENIKILQVIGKNKEEINEIRQIVERKKYLDELSNG